jgi:hypothetical protein
MQKIHKEIQMNKHNTNKSTVTEKWALEELERLKSIGAIESLDTTLHAPTMLDKIALESKILECKNKLLKSEKKRHSLKKSYSNYIRTLEHTNNELNSIIDDLQDQITVIKDFNDE